MSIDRAELDAPCVACGRPLSAHLPATDDCPMYIAEGALTYHQQLEIMAHLNAWKARAEEAETALAALRQPGQKGEAVGVLPNHLSKEKNMAKLTSTIAIDIVERIEDLTQQIESVYAEARTYDGQHNDNVIRDIIEARKTMREAEGDADALTRSFDFEEGGERED